MVGFSWAVRILAFVCLALCTLAFAMVDSRYPKRKPGPWTDTEEFKDINFLVLTAGSSITSLGKFSATGRSIARLIVDVQGFSYPSSISSNAVRISGSVPRWDSTY
jgi:hypothetical protein